MKDAAELNTQATPTRDEVRMPRPDARENPNDLDIQEGHERMQGEPLGRQDTNDSEATPPRPNLTS